MKKQQEILRADVPATQNPAKRLAGQLVERWVNVYASGCLAPVARRWKTQINEIAKAGAGFEVLPEADHNALAGLLNPADIQARTVTLFLHAPSDHPRNHLRLDLTRHGFTVEGLTTDVYEAYGESPAGSHLDRLALWGLHLLLPGNGVRQSTRPRWRHWKILRLP